MIPLKKLLLILLAFYFILFVFVGCVNETQPIPYPTISIRYEIPPEIIFSIRSVEELKFWLWQNYNYVKDDTWSGIKDYPLTPAEVIMSRIKTTKGTIVTKPPISGDCEDYASLTAFILWKAFNYDAYVAIIKNFGPRTHHMIAYGYGPNGEFIVVNSPWVVTRFSSLEEYMKHAYPDKKIGMQKPIATYLEELYIKGHHKYWDEDI